MIGLIVGLIVLSAIIYTFLSTMKSSKEIVNSARLNREVSVMTDLLTGELRRAGYYPVQAVLAGSDYGYGSGQSDFYFNEANNCVLISYYDDAIASVAKRGFRFVDSSSSLNYGTVSSLDDSGCTSLNTPIHDSNNISVSDAQLDLVCIDVATQSAASEAQCSLPTVTNTYSRAVSLAFNVSVVNDSTWTTEIKEFVKLPNDLSP